jgi:hypothetical protein
MSGRAVLGEKNAKHRENYEYVVAGNVSDRPDSARPGGDLLLLVRKLHFRRSAY